MHLNFWKTIGATMVTLAFCAPVSAQKVYRCGNTYQETPCPAGQETKKLDTVTPAQSSAKPGADATCIQRGADSLKVVWAREAGQIAEKQLADVDGKNLSAQKKAEDKKLITEVYQHRGNANEIRAAIEAECMAEKARLAQAAALAAAAAGLVGQPKEAATKPPPSEDEIKAADARRRDEDAAQEAMRKKNRCDALSEQSENILKEQRKGVSAPAMTRLTQQRDKVQAAMREAGC